jgi:hypothetical protein
MNAMRKPAAPTLSLARAVQFGSRRISVHAERKCQEVVRLLSETFIAEVLARGGRMST